MKPRTLAIVVTFCAALCSACTSEPVRVEKPSAPPYGGLDAPAAGKVTGAVTIRAWALSDTELIAKSEVVLDGKPLDVTFTRQPSPWACKNHPTGKACEQASYVASFDFGRVKKGEHSIVFRATSQSGLVSDIGRRTIVVE